MAGLDRDLSALGHGAAGVGEQVEQHLPDRVGVGHDGGHGLVELHGDLDPRPAHVLAGELDDLLRDLVQVHGAAGPGRLAGEGQEALRDRSHAPGVPEDDLEILPYLDG